MSNEYNVRQEEMQLIKQTRMQLTEDRAEWNYDQEVGKVMQKEPFKYQSVQMHQKAEFTEDIRGMIYDERTNPEDQRMFTSNEWQLSFLQEKVLKFPESMPSNQYIRASQLPQQEYAEYYGAFQLQGQVRAKSNQVNYNQYHFNLRSNCLAFYNSAQRPDKAAKQLFLIWLDQRTLDPLLEHDEYLTLKGQKQIKLRKEEQSRELVQRLNQKLMIFAFRGAYGIRFEVPSAKLQDYIRGQLQSITSLDFVHEKKIKQIAQTKKYRQIITSFIGLINKVSSTRKIQTAQITYPEWLKTEYRSLPKVQMTLHTNVVPSRNPLMNLKIKISQNQVQGLTYTLKYIFPFLKNYVKRSLIVYESGLADNEIGNMVNQLNYPLYLLGFPKNELSKIGLYTLIEAGGSLYHEVIDVSYNNKLVGIQGSKIVTMCDNNPSIKKLILRGTYVIQGEQNIFFEALKNSMCLQQIQLDYGDHYNQALTQHLMNYDAIIE